jgi:hypothetical protein
MMTSTFSPVRALVEALAELHVPGMLIGGLTAIE